MPNIFLDISPSDYAIAAVYKGDLVFHPDMKTRLFSLTKVFKGAACLAFDMMVFSSLTVCCTPSEEPSVFCKKNLKNCLIHTIK